MSWTRAIACLKKQVPSQTLRKAFRQKIGMQRIRIIGFLCPCCVIFEKRDCSYEQIGKIVEDILKKDAP